MLSSSTLSDCSTSSIFYVDNISSCLIDDSTNYLTSYYHSPSPLIYNNEIDNLGDFITNHELSIIQQSMVAQAHNNDNNDIQDNSSILELDAKMDLNKSGGDHEHESDIINGIVEDNGELNHIKSTSTITTSHTNGMKIKKKRSSNKDRHSKIRTAHGLRGRRMRLSLQVAHPFFKLQDMLGYDKASATVEWLLMQSKPDIDELLQSKHGSPPSGITTTKCTTTTSSNSNDVDCEVESTAIEEKEGDNAKEKRASSVAKEEPKQKGKRTTKEERKVARERAKRRTLEKKQSIGQAKEGGRNITNSFINHYQRTLYISQNVPSYRISAQQQNIMGGPL